MSLVKKAVFGVVGIAVLFGVFMLQDWYRFAKYSEIDPQRGIFGNDHLEAWIDINAAMPAPMRKWACKTLLDRETAILGGVGPAPYGCDPNFDPNAKGPLMSQVLIDSTMTNATVIAEGQGATKDQSAALKTCMATEFTSKILPAQIEALNGSSPDAATMTSVVAMGQAATKTCFASVGLK